MARSKVSSAPPWPLISSSSSSRERPAGVARERIEERELVRGQLRPHSIDGHLVVGEVDHQPSGHERLGTARRIGQPTPQHCAHPRQQLAQVEGLAQSSSFVPCSGRRCAPLRARGRPSPRAACWSLRKRAMRSCTPVPLTDRSTTTMSRSLRLQHHQGLGGVAHRDQLHAVLEKKPPMEVESCPSSSINSAWMIGGTFPSIAREARPSPNEAFTACRGLIAVAMLCLLPLTQT